MKEKYLNPLIHDMTADTLSHIEAVISVIDDLINNIPTSDINKTTPFGVQVMTNCIRDALRYEINRTSMSNHKTGEAA